MALPSFVHSLLEFFSGKEKSTETVSHTEKPDPLRPFFGGKTKVRFYTVYTIQECTYSCTHYQRKDSNGKWVTDEIPYDVTLFATQYKNNVDIAAFLHEVGHLAHNHGTEKFHIFGNIDRRELPFYADGLKTMIVAQEYEAWMFSAVVLSFVSPMAITKQVIEMAHQCYQTYLDTYYPYGLDHRLIW